MNEYKRTFLKWILEDARKTIEKHPKFKHVDAFEDWVNRYFALGKDGYNLPE